MSYLVLARDRRAVRRAANLECSVVRERGFRLVARRMRDLSQQGMLVDLDDSVLTGEPLLVTFKLPSGETWIDAMATAARVSHGRRPNDRGRTLGVRFDLDVDQRTIVRAHLRAMAPTMPKRAQRIDIAATLRAITA